MNVWRMHRCLDVSIRRGQIDNDKTSEEKNLIQDCVEQIVRMSEYTLTEIELRLRDPTYQRTHIAKELKIHLARHREELRAREQRIADCEKKVETLIHGPFTNIYDLQAALENEHQKEALMKLERGLHGSEIYLTDYVQNTSTDKKKQGIECTFTILGTLKKGDVREEYEVKMYKQNADEKGTFWCSCPDHKFNSTKKNMVCKHICFLVCRVGKMMDVKFFQTKKLSSVQYEEFKKKVDDIRKIFRDPAISRPKNSITYDLFHPPRVDLSTLEEELCPICYDDMRVANTTDILVCPTCSNYVHKGCMAVWLERKDTCVYCRCDSWKLYRQSSL